MNKEQWTIEDIPSLSGKTIVVTGGNSGLGFQAVRAYAAKEAQVIMACRNVSKGEEAKTAICREFPKASIIVMQLDLMQLNSVRKFAGAFKQNFNRLDILLNNAGIMMPPYQLTADGIESQQGTNHFGHFALTGLLLEVLKQTPGSRVVNVSSIAHKQGVMNFDNLLYENGKGYTPLAAYSRSKLENLLFTFELQRYFYAYKYNTMAVVAHPGVSDTNLFSQIGGKTLQTIFKPILKLFTQPASMGALPALRASVDPDAKPGDFFGPDGFAGMRGYPIVVQPSKAAQNSEDARRLWKISEEITGVKFESIL